MTRPTTDNKGPSWKTWLVAFAALALAGNSAAQIFTRPIPDDARRATIRHVQGMTVSLDDRQKMLAPGAHIRDRSNLIITPASLPPDGALAEYTLDPSGQVFRVWLLTSEETSREKRRAR